MGKKLLIWGKTNISTQPRGRAAWWQAQKRHSALLAGQPLGYGSAQLSCKQQDQVLTHKKYQAKSQAALQAALCMLVGPACHCPLSWWGLCHPFFADPDISPLLRALWWPAA